MFGGRADQRRGDLGVDVVEGVRSVVEVVERGGVGHEVGRWVDRRSKVAVRRVLDRVQGLDGDVVVPARPETDNDDPRPLVPAHRQPSATTWPVAGSNVP